MNSMYYENKLESLQNLFGTKEVALHPSFLQVGPRQYPIVEDVIILSSPERYSRRIGHPPSASNGSRHKTSAEFAGDIQFTFGEEWQAYDQVLPEHAAEFRRYFDLVDLESLKDSRVCDLGCGNGRWSYFLKDRCREIVLIDFSDAIFVARRNLRDAPHALFFHCDLRALPFRNDFADFLFCLGVLHHLPTPCLEEVRRTRRWAPKALIFLYYALDNRPSYFRVLLRLVTAVRLALCRIHHHGLRKIISHLGAFGVYYPLILLGKTLKPLGISSPVPLYDFYHNKSLRRIEQDVYDRFFTRIEQRVSRKEIQALQGDYSRLTISKDLPYWHFLCER